MNKAKKIELLSRRFDKDASDGFDAFSDAEMYFESIKNPFESKKVSSGSTGSWRFFIAELVAVMVMLAGVEFIYTAHDVSIEKTPKVEKVSDESTVNDFVLNDQFKEEANVEQEKAHEPVFYPRKYQPKDLNPVALNNQSITDTVVAVEPEIVTNVQQSHPRFEYQNHEKYYKLRYVNDLLVIDYSDSFPETKQLRPVLTGTPASFEKSIDRGLDRNDEDLYENVKYDYVKNLSVAMESYSLKHYKEAGQQFSIMLKKFPKDQNAIFYTGIMAFETGKMQQAIHCFRHLNEMDRPLFSQEADYYLAQCYLKSNDVSQARKLLQKIVHSNSFYQDKAKEMLKKID